MGFFKKRLSDKSVEKKYVKAGAIFGDAVSYLNIGECIGFKKFLKKWEQWEQEYARRGYRTVSLDAFIELGGYGKKIDHLLGQKLEENEEPVFHAEIYREVYLGNVKPGINLEKILKDGEGQFGTYELPSTEKKDK